MTKSFQYERVKIQVVATKPSLGFFDAASLQERTGVSVWQDEEEWTASLEPILFPNSNRHNSHGRRLEIQYYTLNYVDGQTSSSSHRVQPTLSQNSLVASVII